MPGGRCDDRGNLGRRRSHLFDLDGRIFRGGRHDLGDRRGGPAHRDEDDRDQQRRQEQGSDHDKDRDGTPRFGRRTGRCSGGRRRPCHDGSVEQLGRRLGAVDREGERRSVGVHDCRLSWMKVCRLLTRRTSTPEWLTAPRESLLAGPSADVMGGSVVEVHVRDRDRFAGLVAGVIGDRHRVLVGLAAARELERHVSAREIRSAVAV